MLPPVKDHSQPSNSRQVGIPSLPARTSGTEILHPHDTQEHKDVHILGTDYAESHDLSDPANIVASVEHVSPMPPSGDEAHFADVSDDSSDYESEDEQPTRFLRRPNQILEGVTENGALRFPELREALEKKDKNTLVALVDKSGIWKGLGSTPRNAINKSSKKEIDGESSKTKEKQSSSPNRWRVVDSGLNSLGTELSPIVL